MADSSSDDEERYRLLQAVDKEFMTDHLYKEGSNKECEDSKTNSLPSLRYAEENELDQSNVIGLNVTPEFQRYVSRHLSSLLEQQLKEVKSSKKQAQRKIDMDVGIRLLSSSSKNICLHDPVDISGYHNSRYKSQVQDVDSEEDIKISEVAVSANWILSGEAVKGWVKSTRGEVIPGKLKANGTTNLISKKKKKKKKVKKESVLFS